MEKYLALSGSELKSLESVTATKLAGGNLGDLITAIIPYLFTSAGIILLLYLIAGGFGYLTSAGDPKKTESTKSKITTALIGFFIVFLAYVIVRLVALIFSVNPVLNIFQ